MHQVGSEVVEENVWQCSSVIVTPVDPSGNGDDSNMVMNKPIIYRHHRGKG